MKTLLKILIAICIAASAQPLIAQPSDPRYPEQWHLTGEADDDTATIDINVESVWDRYRGSTSTYIAIVDHNMQLDHEDLKDNISAAHNYVYYSTATSAFHGTAVAGVIAARGYNDIGVRGVAPSAKIYSLNLLANIQSNGRSTIEIDDLLDAMRRNARVTSVSNNSWGPADPFAFSSNRLAMWKMAIDTGITMGFHGKGTVYAFAVGNSHCRTITAAGTNNRIRACAADNANYDGYANYHAVVAVCAVDYRGMHNGTSEHGANLWVCAPSRDANGRYGIVTTNTSDRYTTNFSGTSAATPMVSGVVALMRQANPNLSWRDVKLILAASAMHNDSNDSGWQQGAIKYGSFGERYQFNHKYGFGVVDAQSAVALAENWVNLPARTTDTEVVYNQAIAGSLTYVSVSMPVQSNIDFIEYVDSPIRFTTNRYSDLEIKLISPSGTTSTLATPASQSFSGRQDIRWQFGSARHLGEDPSGIWRLEVRDIRQGAVLLREWELRIRGYQIKMNAAPVQGLSDSNIQASPANNPLTLSLSGAVWKPNLQPSDFKLKNAPQGLHIANVMRTSDTQVQLILGLIGGFADNYVFQVEATTGTVSNRDKPLLSNNIEIISETRIAVSEGVAIPDGIVGEHYDFTLDDIFVSLQTLSYTIRGDVPPGLEISGSRISGTPTTVGDYQIEVTASRPDGVSKTKSFDFSILPYNITLHIRVFLEGAAIEVPLIDICTRTTQVRNRIVSLTGSLDCAKVIKDAFESLSELDLSRRGINTLTAGDFAGLAKLQTLILNKNNLNRLPTGIFNGLNNLQTLNLSSNNISTLTSVIFSGLTNLQSLDLSNGEFDTLPIGIFDELSNLQYLDLSALGSEQSLTRLPTGIFDRLTSLQALYLNYNSLDRTYCNNLEAELPQTLANPTLIVQCD